MRLNAFFLSVVFLMANVSVSTVSARQDYSEEECHVNGISDRQRCFTMIRPGGEGETVSVGGVILASDAVAPQADPLVIMTGGPGQAATDSIPLMRQIFRETLRTRELIFLDIRGTAMSNPVSCREYFEVYPPLTYLAPEDTYSPLSDCYAHEGSRLIDANTRTAAGDLDALRQHLNVEQLNIWGVSYGSRLAQYYAVAYGDHVRSLVLDAVVPFSPGYIDVTPASAANAVQRLIRDCAGDAKCSAAYPDFDPYALLDQIDGVRTISYIHPVTGKRVSTQTRRETVAQALFSALYTPASRAAIPYALTEAVKHENWGPLAILADDSGWYFGIEGIYAGARLSVLCAEEDLAADEAQENAALFQDWGGLKNLFRQTCRHWPVSKIDLPDPKTGVLSMPTLMVTGAFDPITPFELSQKAENYFSNVKHIILENGGHSNSHVPCVSKYINTFIQDPAHLAEEPECIGNGHLPDFITRLAEEGTAP